MKKLIATFLNRASFNIRERGAILFSQNAITSFKINDAQNIAKIHVQGTTDYLVIIKWTKTRITHSCSCPYNWEDTCKHTVAGLLKLQNELSSSDFSNISEIKLRRSSTAYNIGKYVPKKGFSELPELNKFHIDNLKKSKDDDFMDFDDYEDEDIEFIEQVEFKITAHVEPEYSHRFFRKTHEIKLFKKKDICFITCSCNEKVAHLCDHQELVLKEIYFIPNMLNLFDEQEVTKQKSKTLLKNGMKITTQNLKLLQAVWHDDEIKVANAPDGLTIMGANISKNHVLKQAIDNLNNDTISLPTSLEDGKGKVKKIGFAVHLTTYSYSEKFNIIPFSACLNKAETMQAANFTQLNSPHELLGLNANPFEEQLLHLCLELKQINGSFYRVSDKKEYIKIYAPLVYKFAKLAPHIDYLYNMAAGFVDTDTIRKKDLSLVPFLDSQLNLSFHLGLENDLPVLKSYLENSELRIDLTEDEYELSQDGLFVLHDEQQHIINNLQLASDLTTFTEIPSMKVLPNELDTLLTSIVTPLSRKYKVNMDNMKKLTVTKKLTDELKLQKAVYLSEIGNFVIFKAIINYQDNVESNILEKGDLLVHKGKKITYYERNLKVENDFLELLNNLHPKFKDQNRDDFYNLHTSELFKDNWLVEAILTFQENDITVFGANELKGTKISAYSANITSEIKSGQDWFDIKTNIQFGDESVTLRQVQKALFSKQKYVKLGSGKLGMLPEKWLRKFETYLRNGKVEGDTIKISKTRFAIIDSLHDELDDDAVLKEIAIQRNKLINVHKIKKIQQPKDLKAKLRGYQKDGLNWLNFLTEIGWGGILADDMGLGKTLQILAVLLKTKSAKSNLIVVPTSLLFNWEKEIEKFCPQLNNLIHYGPTRVKNKTNFKNHKVIITSYGTMMNDIEWLSKIKFNYLVLDESQAIKNPTSLRCKAACLLKGEHKIAMTGTPIENNTFDLFAQMNFANPGYLGTAKSFKDNYSTPIDVNKDEKLAQELQKLTAPFLLRRTKDKVATELPLKTEDYIYCSMEKEQQKVYDAFKNKIREGILENIEEEGLNKSKMKILEGLLKLRQICDSPAILNTEEDYGTESIKIKELLRHIKEKTSNHKILVFSQFVKMLALIQNELEKEDINFEYLDGKRNKKQREQSVENFQNNDNCRVFLISLKAGGTGLNLTEADYVYIVDPWWNPAVENQAIDRCYRIGQTKNVIAYRMICKDTLEEKIIKLQQNKKKLASDLISADENFMKSLSGSDIKDLLN